MTPDQRESIAKAIYAAYTLWHVSRSSVALTAWENLQEGTREMYRHMAEAAYSAMTGEQYNREGEQD